MLTEPRIYPQQLDPQLAQLLAVQREGAPQVDRYAVPFSQSRQLLINERQRTRGQPLPTHSVRDESIVVNGRHVGLRWFHATAESYSQTPLVYLHGGGWCVGSNETHDTVLRHLAHATQRPVCGVDYSLAPEHPFPAALQDVEAVLDQLLMHSQQIVLAGDSAGATLALTEAMRRRDTGEAQQIAALVLFYGAFAPIRASGSYAAYGDGRFGLSVQAQTRYLDAYLPSCIGDDPRAFPLLGELSALPPSHLLAAELDPLFDDSVDLYAALKKAGSPTQMHVAPAMPHGYLNHANQLPQAEQALRDAGDFIRAFG